jgi:hypothetical protein
MHMYVIWDQTERCNLRSKQAFPSFSGSQQVKSTADNQNKCSLLNKVHQISVR